MRQCRVLALLLMALASTLPQQCHAADEKDAQEKELLKAARERSIERKDLVKAAAERGILEMTARQMRFINRHCIYYRYPEKSTRNIYYGMIKCSDVERRGFAQAIGKERTKMRTIMSYLHKALQARVITEPEIRQWLKKKMKDE